MKKGFFILSIIIILVSLVGTVNAFNWQDGTLQVYYSFNETSGTNLEDNSGNGFDGTLFNTTNGNWIQGKVGGGIILNNDTDIEWVNTTFNPVYSVNQNFSINYWFNSTNTIVPSKEHFGAIASDGSAIGVDYTGDVYRYRVRDDGTGDNDISSTTPIGRGVWEMHTLVRDTAADEIRLYINGSLEATVTASQTSDIDLADMPIALGLRNQASPCCHVDGTFDEFGIWNKTLSQSEITELYNGGNGISIAEPISRDVSVSLVSPTNDTIENTESINFSSTGTVTNLNITNASVFVWFSNGTLFNKTTNSSIGDSVTTTNVNITVDNFGVPDNYLWNYKYCGDNSTGFSNCSFASSNFTFEWVPFTVNNEVFNSQALETSKQTFRVNITTASDFTVNSGNLNYNGTVNTGATKLDLGGGKFQLTKTIFIPAGGAEGFGTANKSFFWNLSLNDINTGDSFTSTTSSNNQNITELVFGLCGSGRDVDMLNFTMKDENLGTVINATENPTTFQSTFNLGAHWENKVKNVTVDNQTVNTAEFDFCTDSDDNTIYADMESFITANNYADNNYFLDNATLTNNTNEIDLLLLNESDAIEFFIDVEQDLSPVTNAQVNIKKFFVGQGVYKTVGIKETSSDSGEFTAFLDLDKKYRFTITKDGEVLGTVTKTASCEAAPCEMELTLLSSKGDTFQAFTDSYAQNVLYNLSYNPNTDIVTFDFIDTTGTANYFRLKIYRSTFNETGTQVFDKKLFTSSGTIIANLSTEPQGDYTAEVYVSRSPDTFIDLIRFLKDDFSEQIGLIGFFSAFLIIISIIFGIALSPVAFVVAVPSSLTLAKSMGILAIGNDGLIGVWILAIIAVVFMSLR